MGQVARSALLCRVAGTVLITAGAAVLLGWAYLAYSEMDSESGFDDRVGAYLGTLALLVLGLLAAGAGCWLVLLAERAGPSGTWRSTVVAAVVTAAVVGTVPAVAALRADDDRQARAERVARGRVMAEEMDRLTDSLTRNPRLPLTPALPVPSATLTVHTDGCGVIRSEVPATADNLTWVVKDRDGFQVLGRAAESETRYRYFRSGTYTVVLQAFNGSRYVNVSNEVTITC